MNTELAAKMIVRANADNLPQDHELRVKAAEFDDAAKGYFALVQTCDVKRFVWCWNRARRAWSDYSGEPFFDMASGASC